MEYDGRVWLWFIGAKLLAMEHFLTVDTTMAKLLYAILQKKSIDVSSVIQHSIMDYIQNMRKGFSHPNLITTLCAKVGVQYSISDQSLQPQHIFDRNDVARFMDPKTKKILASESREEPLEEKEPSQMTMPQCLEKIENKLASITEYMRQH
uniref:Putative plant transposon protein domain-containing protein n=1 Tax=Cannabis sativa TaxID=3483 RepID=A0A803PR03_CANSA